MNHCTTEYAETPTGLQGNIVHTESFCQSTTNCDQHANARDVQQISSLHLACSRFPPCTLQTAYRSVSARTINGFVSRKRTYRGHGVPSVRQMPTGTTSKRTQTNATENNSTADRSSYRHQRPPPFRASTATAPPFRRIRRPLEGERDADAPAHLALTRSDSCPGAGIHEQAVACARHGERRAGRGQERQSPQSALGCFGVQCLYPIVPSLHAQWTAALLCSREVSSRTKNACMCEGSAGSMRPRKPRDKVICQVEDLHTDPARPHTLRAIGRLLAVRTPRRACSRCERRPLPPGGAGAVAHDEPAAV
jgi:hypothetical protein